MRSWLGQGLAAARVASERSDLWIPGAAVAFAFCGWLVVLGVVARPIGPSDLAYLGVRIASNPWWPWNLVVLVVAVLSGIGCLLAAIAFGEVAVLMGFARPDADVRHPTVPRAMGILAVVAAPVVALLAVLVAVNVPAFLDAYGRPDQEGPYLVRLAGEVWPALLVLAAAVVVAQPIGAMALRRGGQAGLRVTGRRASRLIPQAALTSTAFVGTQVMTAAMLSALWQPLARRLGGGMLDLSTLVLLLGFVWIWLVLVLLAGVVQVWISAWWSTGPDEPGPTPTDRAADRETDRWT